MMKKNKKKVKNNRGMNRNIGMHEETSNHKIAVWVDVDICNGVNVLHWGSEHSLMQNKLFRSFWIKLFKI